MEWLIVLICVPLALIIYFGIIRPMLIPLTRRIPTGREYRATLGSKF